MVSKDELIKAADEILDALTAKGFSAEESMAVLIAAMASSVVIRVSGDLDKARVLGGTVAMEFASAVEKMVAIHRRHDASKN